MSLTPTSKSNPCQLCEDTTGKCRQGREDQDYWQCMSYADSRKGEIVNGFKCIGHTRDQLWGQFKLDINTGRHYEQRILQKNSRSSGTPNQGTASSIPVLPVPKQTRDYPGRMAANGEDVSSCDAKPGQETNHLQDRERDRAIRNLSSYFGLSQQHREDLRKRGLTDSQIERQLYFSITPDQEAPFGIPPNLPGIRSGQIKAASPGYACVTFDPQGRATGWQIRLDDATDNKYRWAKGEVSSHLANGELPITSVYPSEIKHPGIWISEGISKPAIASQRLGIVALGAASANFASSPQQTEEHLRVASERLGTKEIIFAPDGGAISNPHILKAYNRSWELFTQLGYKTRVAWWGQVDKTHPDIDEVEDFSSITYISPDEFGAIAKGNPVEQQGFDPEPQWKVKAREAWRKNRRFYADIKESSQWCNFARPGANTIAFYKAGLGRGKTTRLRAWVREWKQTEDVSFLCLGYRNTLLLQLCGDKKGLGFYHLHEHSGMVMKSAPSEGIALCVDSLWRFSPEDFDDKIIILDEVKSVIKHLLHSSTVKNRDKIINLFSEAIRRARQVICLDGLMADWVVDYLHSLAPEKQIV